MKQAHTHAHMLVSLFLLRSICHPPDIASSIERKLKKKKTKLQKTNEMLFFMNGNANTKALKIMMAINSNHERISFYLLLLMIFFFSFLFRSLWKITQFLVQITWEMIAYVTQFDIHQKWNEWMNEQQQQQQRNKNW